MTEETLAERDLEPYTTVLLHARVKDVPDTRHWLVLTGEDGQPRAVVPPDGLDGQRPEAELSALTDVLTGFVKAHPTTTVTHALNTGAFRTLDPDTPVILCDERGVVGVWAGFDLADAILRGPARGVGDTGLPGRIDVPVVTRLCRVCGSAMTFAEKPAGSVACTGRPPHDFGW
ncbi:hypothetical protein ABZX30_14500 [Streptomyces sp. NPDC004542]|uniref:hypothetical protein n=1 Tax=Streptomyces sp. NPDC004542 TaxID=3154281 RepID=UPI0033B810A4